MNIVQYDGLHILGVSATPSISNLAATAANLAQSSCGGQLDAVAKFLNYTGKQG
jgi:hypothetical protein